MSFKMSENKATAQTEAEILKMVAESFQNEAEEISDVIPQENDEGGLQQKIAELEAEKAELQDKLLRIAAESENIRRRAERDVQEGSKFAITNFARDLVSVFENLHRATTSITDEMRESSQHFANLAMGVQMTLKEMEKVFAKQKIIRIDPTGEPFNHQLHQAMTKIEDASKPEGTIVQVFQAAYTIHDRLLQPALVAVATAPSQPEADINHVDTQA
jgi:molecular chaperone GrpE